ncbi:MAG: PIN domain-containing protein [Acidobacteria bacterium]|nr:PIN domain-containing protein [Acidobacteriota bacterium]
MLLFPRDRGGHQTLAGEVVELYQAGRFELIISRAVVDELEEIIDRDFAAERSRAMDLLRVPAGQWTRWPTPGEIAGALPFALDAGDAPIFAAAAVAQPDVVLSNDFRAFHSPLAKTFWKQNNITVESLYGLLCVFNRRRRKPNSV